MGSPGRREIGHGKLAWRAVHPMLPAARTASPTRSASSRRSPSQRLLLHGDRLRRFAGADGCGRAAEGPVAGIAMGLIKEADGVAVLSDILGDEDHLGDMDFKVAGTATWRHGATDGHQDHRHHHGDHEDRAGAGPRRPPAYPGRDGQGAGNARGELGEHAPRIETITIPTDKIREVIGSGGKVIRGLVEETGAKIDISDDGTVKIAAASLNSIKDAINRIKMIASEPEVGEIYKGKVVKIVEFGAFVNFLAQATASCTSRRWPTGASSTRPRS